MTGEGTQEAAQEGVAEPEFTGDYTDTKRLVQQTHLLLTQATATIKRLCELAEQLTRHVGELEHMEAIRKVEHEKWKQENT